MSGWAEWLEGIFCPARANSRRRLESVLCESARDLGLRRPTSGADVAQAVAEIRHDLYVSGQREASRSPRRATM